MSKNYDIKYKLAYKLGKFLESERNDFAGESICDSFIILELVDFKECLGLVINSLDGRTGQKLPEIELIQAWAAMGASIAAHYSLSPQLKNILKLPQEFLEGLGNNKGKVN